MADIEKQLSKYIQARMLNQERIEFPADLIQIYIEAFMKENSLKISRRKTNETRNI